MVPIAWRRRRNRPFRRLRSGTPCSWWPLRRRLEQAPYSAHADQCGHTWPLQYLSCVAIPSHPGWPAMPLSHCLPLIWVPPPHDTLQAPYEDHVIHDGQAWVLHAALSAVAPLHPSWSCSPFTHDLVCTRVPPPQVFSHGPHSFHSPQNGQSWEKIKSL